MYKTKLQELCQRRGWDLPDYNTVKIGPAHTPRFTATVHVKGDIFHTPGQCKSSKEAQNTAAQLAFEHFNVAPLPQHPPVNSLTPAVPVTAAALSTVFPVTQATADPRKFPASPLPSSLPIPSPGLVAAKSHANIKSANREVLPQKCDDTIQASTCYRMSIGSYDKNYKDTLHMYKNRLQQYAQKNSLGFPVYTCDPDGPPHNRRFKSRVSLDGKSYETWEYFTTLKEAEQAAAKVACQKLSVDIQEDGGLYKNLLQEFAQKMGLLCPSYETVSYGLSHRPVFVSTVVVGNDTFRGAESVTKKQAEMNAAKVAYFALTERCRSKESSSTSSITSCAVDDNHTQSIQPTCEVKLKQHQEATTEEVQAHAKKAKSEDMTGTTYSPDPSHGDLPNDGSSSLSCQSDHLTAVIDAFKEPPVVEGQNVPQVKNIVFPRKLNLAIPKNATVMPYSDGQWVACKIEVKSKPAAETS